MLQGFWKGVLPSIVMVSNPSVNYMLYEYLRARLEDWRSALSVGDGKLRRTSPAGASCVSSPHCAKCWGGLIEKGGGMRARHAESSRCKVLRWPLE